MKDLFGEEITSPAPLPPGVRHKTQAKGYADNPGTGPAGETCKTCKHRARIEHAKVYQKCLLAKYRWTGGPGSDIKVASPACSRWEAR